MTARSVLATSLVLLLPLGPGNAFGQQTTDQQMEDLVSALKEASAAETAGNAAEAARLVDGIVSMPAFPQLRPDDQRALLALAGERAEDSDDALRAKELYERASLVEGAGAEEWFNRFRLAYRVEDWPDAAESLTLLATRWPAAVPDSLVRPVFVLWSNLRGIRDGESLRFNLATALFDANWTTEWGLQPDPIWSDFAVALVERGMPERAAIVADRIEGPWSLVPLCVDHRLAALVARAPRRCDIDAAVLAQIESHRRIVDENRNSLDAVVQYSYALLAGGRFADVLALADDALARTARAKPEAPAFTDTDEEINWILNNRSIALWGLGRWQDAEAQLVNAARLEERGETNVSQAINLGMLYVNLAQPSKALDEVAKVNWSQGISPYGRMQLQAVRHAAQWDLGDKAAAADTLRYLRQHQSNSEQTYLNALIREGEFETAAGALSERLQDPLRRSEALTESQEYRTPPPGPGEVEFERRKREFFARADVLEAINKVGRRKSFNLYE